MNALKIYEGESEINAKGFWQTQIKGSTSNNHLTFYPNIYCMFRGAQLSCASNCFVGCLKDIDNVWQIQTKMVSDVTSDNITLGAIETCKYLSLGGH